MRKIRQLLSSVIRSLRVGSRHLPSVNIESRLGLALFVAIAVGHTPAAAQTTPVSNVELVPAQADAIFDDYRLRDGETIERLRLHYATLGSPHRNASGDIDNAVMVLHWTGNSGASLLTPEYIQWLFSDGAPLDARRFYLIFPDNLGHGKSTKPSDGLRAKFPHYGYNDLVDLQHRLVTETLGINRLHAILGMSMGGMNAWQWAERYPDQVEAIMPVVCLPAPVSGRNLLWRRLAIAEIRSDPDWQRGNYTNPPLGFMQAYLLLRMMIDGVPHLQATIPDAKAADRYMATILEQNANSDPNDLLYSLESSQDYDREPDLDKVHARVFALNFSDDEFNPDELQVLQSRMKSVKNGRYVVQLGSSETYGHLTMAHPALWAEHVREFVQALEGAPPVRTAPKS
jgi:homoserine O-acetyltransferase/O-succinyltransferase